MNSKKIHVAIIIKAMAMGGMERCITRIANGLSRDRFKITIICLHQAGEATKWIEKDDVNIISLGYATGNSSRLIWTLAKTLRQIKADIAHSHNWATLLETFIASKLVNGVRHLHAERGTLMNSSSNSASKKWLRRKILKYVLRRVDCVMTNARSIADKLESITQIDHAEIVKISNGLDCPYTQEQLSQLRGKVRNELGINNEHCLIGSVGRLHKVKNFELAIRSFCQVHENDTKSRLILVGDGPERNHLTQLVAEHGLQKAVTLCGSRQDAWPYLAAMDIYMNTSHSEGMSQSLVEAMAIGIPIVATDVGDAKHLLTSGRQCGLLVPRDKPNQFSQALGSLIDDLELRQVFAQNAATEHTENYQIRTMIESFERLYCSLCQNRRLQAKP